MLYQPTTPVNSPPSTPPSSPNGRPIEILRSTNNSPDLDFPSSPSSPGSEASRVSSPPNSPQQAREVYYEIIEDHVEIGEVEMAYHRYQDLHMIIDYVAEDVNNLHFLVAVINLRRQIQRAEEQLFHRY